MTYSPGRTQGQIVDSGNTQTVTSVEAQPGVPWVGAWTSTRDAQVVRILTVLAATDTTEGGLGGTFTFEFGEDGVTALISETRPIGDFQTVRDFDLINAGAFYRVQFEPDRALAADQVFITTTLRKQDDGAFVRLANQQIEELNAARPQTFALLQGFTYGGLSENARIGANGALITGPAMDDIALGNVPGVTPLLKFGRNSDVDPGIPEDVWEGGGLYTGQSTTITTGACQIVSDDSTDSGALAGAQTVRIWGLSSGAYITEDLTMAGLVPVPTVNNYERIFRVEVLTAGATEGNAGILTVSHVATGSVFAAVPVGLNQSQVAAFTVPTTINGDTVTEGLIRHARVTIARSNGSAGSAHVTLRRRPSGGVYNAIRSFEVTTGVAMETLAPIDVQPGDDLKFRVEEVSDTNTIVLGQLDVVFYHA